MNKLRSDSAFCQLTPEQSDTLEGWLFEERMGYPKVVERLKSEFGLETSLTGVRRFYKRLDVERSAQSLADAVEMSGSTVEALKSGNLKPAMLLFANKCLFELLRQEPVPIKEVTTLLRAITSAEARAFRQTVDDREQAALKERERVRRVEEERSRARWEIRREDEELERKRAARKKTKLKAVEKAAKERENIDISERKVEAGVAMNLSTPHPGPLPVEGRGSSCAPVAREIVVAITPTREEPSDPLALRGTSREREGERGFSISTKNADVAWRPSVVEEREYEENNVAEAGENRLAPLNAA